MATAISKTCIQSHNVDLAGLELAEDGNSCVFHCFTNAFPSYREAQNYRNILYNLVEEYDIEPAMLESLSIEEYQTHILNSETCGGRVEIVLLATYFNITVVVYDALHDSIDCHPPNTYLNKTKAVSHSRMSNTQATSETSFRLYLWYNGYYYRVFYEHNSIGEKSYLIPYQMSLTKVEQEENDKRRLKPFRIHQLPQEILSSSDSISLHNEDIKRKTDQHKKSLFFLKTVKPKHAPGRKNHSRCFPYRLVCEHNPSLTQIECSAFVSKVRDCIKKQNSQYERQKLCLFPDYLLNDFYTLVEQSIGWHHTTSMFSSSCSSDSLKLLIKDFPDNDGNALSNFLILMVAWITAFIEINLLKDNYNSIKWKLVTSYQYHCFRHKESLDRELAKVYVMYFCDPNINIPLKKGELNRIESAEKECATYFGSYISSDSDDEADTDLSEPDYLEKNIVQQMESNLFYKRAHTKQTAESTITYKKGDLNLELGATPSRIIPIYERAVPQRPIPFTQDRMQKIDKDLQFINDRLEKNEPIDPSTLSKYGITTQFYVAQYRGIHYNVATWNAPARRKHRSTREIDCALSSLMVNHANSIDEMPSYKNELLLSEIFRTLQEPALWIKYNYTFTSLSDLLQHVYTTDYAGFLHMIQNENLFFREIFLNGYNPYVSTGDIPEHALQYAYGNKFYQGQAEIILKPRWDNENIAERPYAGKLYVSLHPIDDYASISSNEHSVPNHVVSLNYSARIQIPIMIVKECETSFLAYMPHKRVVFEHIAKYPSFNRRWSNRIYKKYGFSKTVYEILSKFLKIHPPHSSERTRTEDFIAEWLCCYHGMRLVEMARREVEEKRDGVLVYRNEIGQFQLLPLKDPDPSKNLAYSANVTEMRKDRTISPPIKSGRNRTEKSSSVYSLEMTTDYEKRLNVKPRYSFYNEDPYQPFRNIFWILLNAIDNNLLQAFKHFISGQHFRETLNYRLCTLQWHSFSDTLSNAHIIHLCALQGNWDIFLVILEASKIHNFTLDLTTGAYYRYQPYSQRNDIFTLKDLTWLHCAVLTLLKHPSKETWMNKLQAILNYPEMKQNADGRASITRTNCCPIQNWTNVTPLHMLLLFDASVDIIEQYLNIVPHDLKNEDADKKTALDYATSYNSKTVPFLLRLNFDGLVLSAGADTDKKSGTDSTTSIDEQKGCGEYHTN